MKVYTLNGVPYTFDPVRAVLVKAARRRQVSPGQLGLFGGPNEGDTKVENGVTYRLNANSRWERADEPNKPREIVPVIEENTMETVQTKKAFKYPKTYGISARKEKTIPEGRIFYFFDDVLKELDDQILSYGYRKGKRYKIEDTQPVYYRLALRTKQKRSLEQDALFEIQRDDNGNYWAIGSNNRKYPILEMQTSVHKVLSAVAPDPEYSEVDAPYTHRELLADYYSELGHGPSKGVAVDWNPIGKGQDERLAWSR